MYTLRKTFANCKSKLLKEEICSYNNFAFQNFSKLTQYAKIAIIKSNKEPISISFPFRPLHGGAFQHFIPNFVINFFFLHG